MPSVSSRATPAWDAEAIALFNAGYRAEMVWAALVFDRGYPDPGIGAIQRAQTRYRKAGLIGKGVVENTDLVYPAKAFPERTPIPWELSGDKWGIMGDLHFPLTDWSFLVTACNTFKAAGVTDVTLAGDTFNFDYYSTFERTSDELGLAAEHQHAVRGLDLLLNSVERIWVILGNHDRRILKKLNGVPFNIGQDLMLAFLGGQRGGRVRVASLDHHYLHTEAGDWIVAHGADSSAHPGAIAAELALSEHKHAVVHHLHQYAITTDRTGRYIAIHNGMMADARKINYVGTVKHAKARRMMQSFLVLEGGRPRLVGGPSVPMGLRG